MKKESLFDKIKNSVVKPIPCDAVPEWGTVYILSLTVGMVESRIGKAEDEGDDNYILSKNIARALCDEDGNLIFDEHNDEHLQIISRQSWGALDGLRKKMEEINGPKA